MLKNSKKLNKSNNIDNDKIDLDKEIVIGLKKPTQKPKKNNKKKKSSLKHLLFCIFVIISLILILKMLLIF